MPHKIHRRFSRWYEILIFNPISVYLLGLVFVVVVPAWLRWADLLFCWDLTVAQLNTLVINASAFTLTFMLLHKSKRLPGTQALPFIIPSVLLAWFLAFTALVFLREGYYSRPALFYSFVAANLWAFLSYFLGQRYGRLKLALVPFGRAIELMQEDGKAQFYPLQRPSFEGERFDGIVVDLSAPEVIASWGHFLALCTLARIPVYNTQQIAESVTGRVRVRRLSENIFGSLLPSAVYIGVKRFYDSVLILVTAPLWLPLMLVTGLIIVLESKGPMFFTQERVGRGNKIFKLYKLRSMRVNADQGGAQFAQKADTRITRVGQFIRKTRLDEIPQFINVLRGDMSLIGPRPEQKEFVEKFEKEIPFYSYRHVVRPGITGWAQVTQGYTANAADTKLKIQYDLYYIKNFSLWLDLLVMFKTIRTIFTGFGAR